MPLGYDKLAQIARSHGLDMSSDNFASLLDKQDELSHFKDFFHSPSCKFENSKVVYLVLLRYPEKSLFANMYIYFFSKSYSLFYTGNTKI